MSKTALLLAIVTVCCSFDGLEDIVAKSLWVSRHCRDDDPVHMRTGEEIDMGKGWVCVAGELDHRHVPASSEVNCWDGEVEKDYSVDCSGKEPLIELGNCRLTVRCRGFSE